ncbi:MAG: RrF2 family transcriptional regulator [Dehalococcoidia bacterium]
MQVTEGSNYAFHGLMQMTQMSPGQAVTIEEMALSLGASPSYMAKLFQRLARAGLVTSHRGRGGGYYLARPGHQITLWEIVAALQENPATDTPPLPSCLTCPLASACPLKGALRRAGQKVEQILRTVNVAGVAALVAEGGAFNRRRGP